MKAKFSDQKAIRMVGLLVAALAVPVLWSWLAPFPETNSAVAAGAKVARGIASIPPASTDARSGKFSRPVTLDWDVFKEDLQREVDGTHLRLKGVLKNVRPSEIVNQTNGFTAAVFTGEEAFSTDFIELREGANEIRVEGVDGRGRKLTRTLQITRAPASP